MVYNHGGPPTHWTQRTIDKNDHCHVWTTDTGVHGHGAYDIIRNMGMISPWITDMVDYRHCATWKHWHSGSQIERTAKTVKHRHIDTANHRHDDAEIHLVQHGRTAYRRKIHYCSRTQDEAGFSGSHTQLTPFKRTAQISKHSTVRIWCRPTHVVIGVQNTRDVLRQIPVQDSVDVFTTVDWRQEDSEITRLLEYLWF